MLLHITVLNLILTDIILSFKDTSTQMFNILLQINALFQVYRAIMLIISAVTFHRNLCSTVKINSISSGNSGELTVSYYTFSIIIVQL